MAKTRKAAGLPAEPSGMKMLEEISKDAARESECLMALWHAMDTVRTESPSDFADADRALRYLIQKAGL